MIQRDRWRWPLVLTLSALGVGVSVFWDIEYALRPVLALWFILVCPGMALVRLLRIGNVVIELTLVIAVSLLVTLFVTTATVYAGSFSPDTSLLILVAITVIGAGLQLLNDWRTVLTFLRL